MRAGKLPPELLARLLARIPRTDSRVVLGSSIGEDAAAIDFCGRPHTLETASGGDRLLVAKTDPVTFATDRIGWYAVHVNANDVACTGATPRWFLASALLPTRWEESHVSQLVDQLIEACNDLQVTLVGGHTEVTSGIDRPIVVGCMLGEVERTRLVRTGGGLPGDDLVLTQGLAIEGTAVLAREAADRLRQQGVPANTIARAQELLFTPGISVVTAAQTLCAIAPPPDGVHSLHDPTEGGLAAGVWEVAEASGTGALIDSRALRILPETQAVCNALGLDPLGLLASGALLAAVAPAATAAVLDVLHSHGIPAQRIGSLVPRANGIQRVASSGDLKPWPHFERDEVARYFDEARSPL